VEPRTDLVTADEGVGRVVVGVDGSDGARAALVWGLGEAARRGSALLVVSAFPVDVYWMDAYLLDERRVDGARTHTEARVRQLLDEVRRDPAITAVPGAADVATDVVVAAGAPAEHLVGLARPRDLLVVGSRGRGAVRGALLGSVALHCVTHARCPVVVVHRAPPPRQDGARPVVVVGVDGSTASRAALAVAAEQASRQDGRVQAVAVAEPPDVWAVADGLMPVSSGEGLAATRAAATDAIGTVLGPEDAPGRVPVELITVEGSPAHELVERAAAADLLVVGSRGRATLPGLLLGSVALRAVVRSTTPVMVVHPSPTERSADAGSRPAVAATT
jgi:nucleotide-binding universal stress UspA family protein